MIRTALTCPRCVSPVREGSVFCTACGARFAPLLPATLALICDPPPVATPPAQRQDARGLAAMTVVGGATVAGLFWRFRDGVPGFAYVFDFKTALASLLLALTAAQLVSAALFYGWLPLRRPSAAAAAFYHRWNGRVLVPAAVLIALYCAQEAGPQSGPLRPAMHTVLGGVVFVVLAAKLLILRFVPRLSRLVPVLGVTLVLLFCGLWSTSALAYLMESGTPAAGAAGKISARVQIVDQAGTPGAFAPAEVHIRAGQVVEWTNASSKPHTVTDQSGTFDSGRIRQAGAFSRRFDTRGAFTYVCAIHDGMTAARVVVE